MKNGDHKEEGSKNTYRSTSVSEDAYKKYRTNDILNEISRQLNSAFFFAQSIDRKIQTHEIHHFVAPAELPRLSADMFPPIPVKNHDAFLKFDTIFAEGLGQRPTTVADLFYKVIQARMGTRLAEIILGVVGADRSGAEIGEMAMEKRAFEVAKLAASRHYDDWGQNQHRTVTEFNQIANDYVGWLEKEVTKRSELAGLEIKLPARRGVTA